MSNSSTPSRLMQISARLGVVVLLALLASSLAVIAPTGVAAEDSYGGPRTRPTDDGDNPGENWNPDDSDENADTGSDVGTGQATTDETGGGTLTVTTDLNLRAGPSTESDVLTVMPAGSSVQTTGGSENGFYGVTFDGVSGYAYGDYLSTGGVETQDAPAQLDDGGAQLAGSGETDIVSIIYAAADTYGQSREDMLRVATCESGLDPNNVTPPYDASGLFQFLPGTWASTPFAAQSVFDPVANANAAAWMWSVGRRNEWVCQ
jgi:hypothetical protein